MRNNDVEREASLFALFLLMPADLLIQEIENAKLDFTDSKGMKLLCEKFGVSLTALTVRMNYLSVSQKKRIGLL